MWPFDNKRKIREFINVLKGSEEVNQKLRYLLFLDISKYLENKNFENESAKVLAIQIVNYLMGDDLDKVYHSYDSGLQQKIDTVKKHIKPLAQEIMVSMEKIRELVIRTLLLRKSIFTDYKQGHQFANAIEMKNTETILNLFGKDLETTGNQERYQTLIIKYFEKHKDKFEKN